MANTFIHGKDGRVLIGSTDFAVEQFAMTHTVTTDDITHTAASGYRVILPGIESMDGTITFIYDTLNKPTVSPNLTPGTTATIHFKPDGVDDFTGSFVLTELSWSSGPKAGAVRVNAKAMSSGAFTKPSS